MTIGFIGMGIMGKPMAKNLLKAGYPLRINSRSDRTYEEMQSLGAVCCATPAETASDADILVLMLPDSPDCEKVLFGENGAAAALHKGAIVIDMSSVSPAFPRSAAERLSAFGIEMLDAPVSGGEQGAIDGTLSIMAGGKEAVFSACEPILRCMGKRAALIGGIGAGNVCKLVNQIIVASTLTGMSEAFAMAKRNNVDLQSVFDAIRQGMAGGAMLEAKAPKIIQSNYTPGFYLDLQIKDLKNAQSTLDACGMQPLMTDAALQAMEPLSKNGMGHLDHSAVYHFFDPQD